jgi:hypothetical protein
VTVESSVCTIARSEPSEAAEAILVIPTRSFMCAAIWNLRIGCVSEIPTVCRSVNPYLEGMLAWATVLAN